MYRRTLLVGVAAAAAGCSDAVGGALDSDPLVDKARLNSHLDRVEWTESGELSIYFDSSDSDAWTLHHADTAPSVQDTLAHGGTPRFEGPVRLDFQKVVDDAGYAFPSREFQIVLWEADRGDEVGLITGAAYEEMSSFSFEVPEESGVVV